MVRAFMVVASLACCVSSTASAADRVWDGAVNRTNVIGQCGPVQGSGQAVYRPRLVAGGDDSMIAFYNDRQFTLLRSINGAQFNGSGNVEFLIYDKLLKGLGKNGTFQLVQTPDTISVGTITVELSGTITLPGCSFRITGRFLRRP